MRVFLASPNNQLQAHAVNGMDVLVSYALWKPWLADYLPTFRRILVDSGAFSEFNSGTRVDLDAYVEWAPTVPGVLAWAGLDDISGDWRRSLKNYERGGFPTFHESDPWDVLPDLVAIARERGRWIGLGLIPPRGGKESTVRRFLDSVPDDLHVHGWALRGYTHLVRLDSVDSTNWWRDGMKLRTLPDTRHLTYGECLEIVVKRYQRWTRLVESPADVPDLFTSAAGAPDAGAG